MRNFIRHLNLVMAGALLLQVSWAVGELAGQSPIGWGFYQLAVIIAEMEPNTNDQPSTGNDYPGDLPNGDGVGQSD